MRYLFNLAHPAHVHLFRNAILELESRGHSCKVTVINKEVALDLLDHYGIDYEVVGDSVDSLLHKGIELLKIDCRLLKIARSFRPDVLIGGVGNAYIAHVGRIIGKPALIFDDTEHAKLQHFLTDPFATAIYTPSCYRDDLGKKQVRYEGYHELAYLHPNRFRPDPKALESLGIDLKQPIILLRFVSWTASHDVGVSGLTMETKLMAVREFSKYGKVYITSEKPLQKEFEEYRVSIPPQEMHNLLYHATLLYGESATMASECAVLGTHAIYCDFCGRGYTDEQEERYGLVYNFRLDEDSQKRSVVKAVELLREESILRMGESKRLRLLDDKIDLTGLLIDVLDDYQF